MIQENQKKTISDWNVLVRAALLEIDDQIGESKVSERNAVLTFEEFRNWLQILGSARGFDMERIGTGTSSVARTDSKDSQKRC
jgi:hypothetical protein